MPCSPCSHVTLHPAKACRPTGTFMLHRVVLVVCLGIYAVGALIGFDDYGKICLSADRVLWHGEGGCPAHAPCPLELKLSTTVETVFELPWSWQSTNTTVN